MLFAVHIKRVLSMAVKLSSIIPAIKQHVKLAAESVNPDAVPGFRLKSPADEFASKLQDIVEEEFGPGVDTGYHPMLLQEATVNEIAEELARRNTDCLFIASRNMLDSDKPKVKVNANTRDASHSLTIVMRGNPFTCQGLARSLANASDERAANYTPSFYGSPDDGYHYDDDDDYDDDDFNKTGVKNE